MDLFIEYLSQFQRKAEKYYNLKKEFEATALTFTTSLLGSEKFKASRQPHCIWVKKHLGGGAGFKHKRLGPVLCLRKLYQLFQKHSDYFIQLYKVYT